MCPQYFPHIGGVETHVRELSERLVKKGYELVVLTSDVSGSLPKEENINVVHVRRFESWAPGEAYYFSRSLKRFLTENSSDFDVVHAHSYHAFPALYAALAKCRNKLIFTPHYHGRGHTIFRSLLHIPYKSLGKRIFEKADMIICVSHYEESLIKKNFKIDKEKIVVIPNGVNSEEFRFLKKKKKNYQTILSVARLEKYKGLQHLVRVMPHLGNDVILEIVGKGPYKGSLVRLAQKLGVTDRIKFSRNLLRSELLQKYCDAGVFVLLSEHEAYGISVAEALCAGVPCIVGKTSALEEWIDEKNCFGINFPIDLNELGNLISSVIGKGIDARARMKIHDWNEVTEKITSLYECC